MSKSSQQSGRGFTYPVYDDGDKITINTTIELRGSDVNAIIAFSQRGAGMGTNDAIQLLVQQALAEHRHIEDMQR